MRHYTITRDSKIMHVYEGQCQSESWTNNSFLTRWITQSPWDGKLTLKMTDGGMIYMDSSGKEMLVYEEDEEEYHMYDR
jgi:hypothetical protein